MSKSLVRSSFSSAPRVVGVTSGLWVLPCAVSCSSVASFTAHAVSPGGRSLEASVRFVSRRLPLSITGALPRVVSCRTVRSLVSQPQSAPVASFCSAAPVCTGFWVLLLESVISRSTPARSVACTICNGACVAVGAMNRLKRAEASAGENAVTSGHTSPTPLC